MIIEENESSTKQCWVFGDNCKGSACMAWEFVREKVKKEATTSIIYSTDYEYVDTPRGYCAALPSKD